MNYQFKGCIFCGVCKGTNGVNLDNQETCDKSECPSPDALKTYKASRTDVCCNTTCYYLIGLGRTHCSRACKRTCTNHNPSGLTVVQLRQLLIQNGKTPCHNNNCPHDIYAGHRHCALCGGGGHCDTCRDEKN